jgi:hypothetical protein
LKIVTFQYHLHCFFFYQAERRRSRHCVVKLKGQSHGCIECSLEPARPAHEQGLGTGFHAEVGDQQIFDGFDWKRQ